MQYFKMIPKRIHYCWLNGLPFLENFQRYFDEWKQVLLDYEFHLWDVTAFDVNSVVWGSVALEERKYTFTVSFPESLYANKIAQTPETVRLHNFSSGFLKKEAFLIAVFVHSLILLLKEQEDHNRFWYYQSVASAVL